jgi:hypothetical protein
MKRNLIVVIVLIIVFILINAIYKDAVKSNPYDKSSRIECQRKITTFERTYIDKDIKSAQSKLANGNFAFTSSVQKSVYAKSKLFDYVKLSDIDKVVNDELESYTQHKSEKSEKLNITYYIYENDVNDPGKKTEKSKLYAGYIVFKFLNPKNELIYQVQVDFMDKQGDDLPQSVKCAIESFVTL